MRERVSKRVLGFISAIAGLTMAFLDGFGWFNANEIVMITIFSFSASLLGMDALKQFNKE